MLVDSHCHLDMLDTTELPAIIDRAHASGVTEMVSIGTRLAQSETLPGFVAGLPGGVWCTVGVHPLHVHEAPLAREDDLLVLTDRPRVVGIGESGLDYHYDAAPASVQEQSFRTHIRVARAAGLPLVVHARDADADIARILRDEHEGKGPFAFVLHCFSSGRALAEEGVALGGYVSFSGILTFPKSHALRDLARDLPADRLLVETDAPYLAPVPHRGRTNEPGWTAHTARVLAGVRGLTADELAGLTTANFRRLFPRAVP